MFQNHPVMMLKRLTFYQKILIKKALTVRIEGKCTLFQRIIKICRNNHGNKILTNPGYGQIFRFGVQILVGIC